jgi:hypothetical protein
MIPEAGFTRPRISKVFESSYYEQVAKSKVDMANDFVLLLARPDVSDGRVKVAVVSSAPHLLKLNS